MFSFIPHRRSVFINTTQTECFYSYHTDGVFSFIPHRRSVFIYTTQTECFHSYHTDGVFSFIPHRLSVFIHTTQTECFYSNQSKWNLYLVDRSRLASCLDAILCLETPTLLSEISTEIPTVGDIPDTGESCRKYADLCFYPLNTPSGDMNTAVLPQLGSSWERAFF